MQNLLLPYLTARQPPFIHGIRPLAMGTLPPSPIILASPVASSPPAMPSGDDEGCKLLDGFAILVQICLATTAFLVLVFKRYRERPQRPVPIWALDVSKQFVGAAVIHFLNLLVSYLVGRPKHGPSSNLCVWYFLNVGVDTTLGVGLLWAWLHGIQWVLEHKLHVRYIHSGNYGPGPIRRQWLPWLKQTIVFITSVALMKFCVYLLFRAFPILFAFGNWVLRWTRGNYRYQVVFVMFIFPLIMNAIQFWITDTIVKVNPAVVTKKPSSARSYTEPHGQHTRVPHDDEGHHASADDERAPLLPT